VRGLLGTAEEDIGVLQVGGFSDTDKEKEIIAVLDGIISITSGAQNVDKARALFLKASIYWGKIWFGLEGGSVGGGNVARDEVATVDGGEVFGALVAGDVLREFESGHLYDVEIEDLGSGLRKYILVEQTEFPSDSSITGTQTLTGISSESHSRSPVKRLVNLLKNPLFLSRIKASTSPSTTR